MYFPVLNGELKTPESSKSQGIAPLHLGCFFATRSPIARPIVPIVLLPLCAVARFEGNGETVGATHSALMATPPKKLTWLAGKSPLLEGNQWKIPIFDRKTLEISYFQ